MSKAEVEKPVYVDICDYCDGEIEDDNYTQWAHIVRGYISAPQKTATALRFLWKRSYTEADKKPDKMEIVYDFHAACFDKLMQEFKKGKS